MSALHPFDVHSTPLPASDCLLEANAGTGKTYALVELFLRLLLEERHLPERILMATFTTAACEELKGRVFRRLQEERRTLLLEGTNISAEQGLSQRIIADALERFEDIPIYTIHSFCTACLQRFPLETQTPIRQDLIEDTALSHLRQELSANYWRKMNAQSAATSAFFHSCFKTHEKLLKEYQKITNYPGIRITPAPSGGVLEGIEHFFTLCHKNARLLRHSLEEVREIMDTHPALKRSSYRPADNLKRIAKIKIFLAGFIDAADTPLYRLFVLNYKIIEYFLPEVMAEKASGTAELPQHDFFELCGQLWQVYQQCTRDSVLDYCRYMRQQEEKKRRSMHALSYDDMLLSVHRTLGDRSRRAALITEVQQSYSVALIDEFQDTDAIQYAIFKTFFSSSSSINSAEKHRRMFLIGDPKQSIYRFRGADLQVYLKAKQSIPSSAQFQLLTNYRTDPQLCESVNHIFLQNPIFFGSAHTPESAGINFVPSQTPEEATDTPLICDGVPQASFQLWYYGDLEELASKKKDQSEQVAARIAADRIALLLHEAQQGKTLLGEQPLEAGDIAVLVRTGDQTALMHEALRDLGVPSCLEKKASRSVLDSRELEGIEYFFAALAHPKDERALLRSLSSALFGLKAKDILELQTAPQKLQGYREDFLRYQAVYAEKGAARLLALLYASEGVAERLASSQQGEQAIANYQHCLELVAEQEDRLSRPPNAYPVDQLIPTLRRFAQRQGNTEHYAARVSAQTKAVRLMTIHASKGLEFPLVFCPFLWSGHSEPKKNAYGPVIFHDHQFGDMRAAFEEEPHYLALAQQEEQLEENRLLYVALTRAAKTCILLWGNFKTIGSAFSRALFGKTIQQPRYDDFCAVLDKPGFALQYIEGLTEEDRQTLGNSAERAAYSDYKPPPPASALPQVNFTRWKLLSFSGALHQSALLLSSQESEKIDVHEQQPNLPSADPPADLSSAQPADKAPLFPAGTQSGLFFHQILEQLAFADTNSALLQEKVGSGLAEYGFAPELQQPAVEMIERALHARLPDGKGGCFHLSDPAVDTSLREMEFYFPCKESDHPAPELFAPPTEDNPFQQLFYHTWQSVPLASKSESFQGGFFHGFIDLVARYQHKFYIIDWKSNALEQQSDYLPQNLLPVMQQRAYALQYTLYALALHKYLTQNMTGYSYAEHFGGVHYVFLRGLPENTQERGIAESGVFFDPMRDRLPILERLEQYFSGTLS